MPKNEPEFKEDILQIILNESRDLRNQQLEHLFQTSENIWGSLNLLLVLLGIYASVFLFLCDFNNVHLMSNKIITCPLIISVLFILFAIVRAIIGIFPTNKFRVPTPNAIYELLAEEKEIILEKFTQTYLLGYGSIIISAEERNSLRKEIIMVALASIVEFIFFVSALILKNLTIMFVTISIIFVILFVVFMIGFIESEGKRIEMLQEDMNS
ncbi:hypothetical protein [Methanosarcina horonobensis]|nr:hypothetical protein [Methanosarcina horonobensis]